MAVLPTPKTRFAPSPTGHMHFGNLRTALFNYLFAKRIQGSFLLRIEDTDLDRSEAHFTKSILEDLSWLSLEWQEGPYYQSERQAIYDDYYERLAKGNCVYPCFCTEAQLAIIRKVQLASHQPPRYPGTCRHLTEADINAKKAQALPFTLRFRIPDNTTIAFDDLIKGPQRFDTSHIGDFIIRRGDGTASFMFCNAIDDVLMGVTHALRGDDHLTNTPRQILILQALKLQAPQYGHFPTILGPDSRPLSKRNGSRSIQELRQEGYLPLGIVNYLARLGHHNPDLSLLTLENLAQHFDLVRIGHAPAHYDSNQLHFWQKEAMRHSDWRVCWQQIAPYVAAVVPNNKREAFIIIIKTNIVMPSEALLWANVIFAAGPDWDALKPEVVEAIKKAGTNFFQVAAGALPKQEVVYYAQWIHEVQKQTELRGKSFFSPLRAALTGELHGPELEKIVELMGVEKVKLRLEKAAQYAHL